MNKCIEFVKRNKRKIEIIILVIMLILCVIIVGINRIKRSDFNPINGDFQNYNPIRRLLNGQVPYKDFAVYLGTGHLFLLSGIQLLVGDNYTASLFVTNMTTALMFELTVFMVSFFLLKDKRKALYVTLGMMIVNITKSIFITGFFKEILQTVSQNGRVSQFVVNILMLIQKAISVLDFGISPGLSARLIRIAILPIIVLMFYLGLKWLNHSKKEFVVVHKLVLSKIYIALVAGATILWSNDGGIATYIATSFVYFLLLIKEHKKNLKHIVLDTLMYIGISLCSFLVLLIIVTRGNVLSWFEFTFGVSEYQKWYYTEASDKLNLFVFQIDMGICNIMVILLAIYHMYWIFKSKEKTQVVINALLSILLLGAIISTYLYQLIAGGVSDDILYIFVWIWIVCQIFRILLKYIHNKKIHCVVKMLIILTSVFVIGNNVKDEIKSFQNREGYVYIEELGGYFSKLGDSIKMAMEKIEDKKIFSTYASAIDVATNQFQPTGIDYIIHCLGDRQREEYMQIFRKGQFDYVTTTDKNYSTYNGFEYWIRNANWFFYRELYQDYIPVFTTEYNVFWEKNHKTNSLEDAKQNAEIKMKQKSDAEYTIEVITKDKDFNGIADVKLTYCSGKTKNFFQTGNLNQYVYVKDITGKATTDLKIVNYNIPNISEGYYVPVTIVNGTGNIEICSYPIRKY